MLRLPTHVSTLALDTNDHFLLYKGRVFTLNEEETQLHVLHADDHEFLPTYATILLRGTIKKFDEKGKLFREEDKEDVVAYFSPSITVHVDETQKLFLTTETTTEATFNLRVDNLVQQIADIDVFMNKFVLVVTDYHNNRLKVFHRSSTKFLRFIPVKKPTKILFVDAKHTHVISNNETYHIFATSSVLLSWRLPQPWTQITSNGKEVFLTDEGGELHTYQLSWDTIPDPKVRTRIHSSSSSLSSSSPSIKSPWNKL